MFSQINIVLTQQHINNYIDEIDKFYKHQMLDIIDYRNLRYQGQTKDKQPHGLGIIIDYNHLFCLALWKQGKIYGPAFIVFPDNKIFCGRIREEEVDGLCCFYLQETIRTFANYSARADQKRNFISILPFCRLILQVDHKQSKYPKISSHQRYKPNDGSLQRQLTRLFKRSLNLQQYNSWKDFLLLNFIQPYRKKLQWKQTKQKRYTEYFIGAKYSGLGIKLLSFNEEEDIVRMDGETVIPIEMGLFSNQNVLNGLGKRVDDLQYFKHQSEGDFGEDEANLLVYERKARHKKAIHFFLQQLKLSPFFENTFLDLRYIHDLSTIYSKFNVQLVEETQKIAQVILENPDESTVVLAEIEQKRQRRRITPQKSVKSLISSEYQATQKLQLVQRENDKSQKSVSRSKHSQIIPLTQIRKQIYSSVEKKSANQLKKQYLQKTPQSIEKPKQHNGRNQFNFQPAIQNYQRPQKERQSVKYLNKTPIAAIYTKQFSPSTSNEPPENRYRSKETLNFNFNKRQPTIQPVTFPSREINIPNGSRYNDRRATTFSQNISQQHKRQPLGRHQTDHKPDVRKNRIFNQQFVYNPVEQNKQKYRQKFQLDDSSEVDEKMPHAVNRQIDDSLEYQQKSKQNRQLIDFFNKAMEDPYSSLEKEENINKILHWTLGNSPASRKTPGKIRTIKKKQEAIEDPQ